MPKATKSSTSASSFPIYDTGWSQSSTFTGETSTRKTGSATCTWPVHAPGSLTARRYHEALPLSLPNRLSDAVTLYDQGFTNVIPAYGVNGVTEDHLVLFNGAVTEVYLCFDSDQAGKDGASSGGGRSYRRKE
ncbi:MAG: hypothetical protein JKP90_10010 [Desulfofustis sp. PB-SRB1]|nr:hypothetical protein [Desulfofustis sp. PB-SRB1]